MSLLQRSSLPQAGRVVLLSIKPKYADLILAGLKRVEFRRSWAVHDVQFIVLYSSSPVQKIVGVVEVESVVTASPTALWKVCSERGGGLTRAELRAYYVGKPRGVAIFLGKILKLTDHVDPFSVIMDFVPPQSFRYLQVEECLRFGVNIEKLGEEK